MWMLRRLKSLNLANKAALTAALLFIGGFLPLVYFSTLALERNLMVLLANQQTASVRHVAHDLEQNMHLRIDALQDVANKVPMDAMLDRRAMAGFLSSRIAIYRFYANGVVVIGRDGYGIADQPQVAGRGDGDFRALEFFQEVVKTGKPAIGKPRVGRFTREPGIGVAVPIKNAQGEMIGVMAGFLSLLDKQLFDQTGAKLGKTGSYTVVSSWDKLIIAGSHKDHILKPVADLAPGAFTELTYDGLDVTQIGDDLTGTPALLSDAHILDGRWLVIGSLPVAEAFAPIRQLQAQIYSVAAIIVVLVSALMWAVMRRQLGIVARATLSLERMAQGSDVLAPLPVKRRDEVGQMLHAFNALQAKIHDKDAALQQSRARFQNLFEHMTNGFALHEMIFDAQGVPSDYRFLEVNPAFEALTGLTAQQVIGKTVLQVMPDLEGHWIKRYGELVVSGRSITFEDHAGEVGHWYRVNAYRPEHGKFAVIIENITELKKAQDELKHLAFHDVLTGLPNRTLFADRMRQAMAVAKRSGALLAVVYLDLDRFKFVNDNYGHAVGDLLLMEVAARFKEDLRSEDSISRFGGDEFALLLTGLKSESELHELLKRLLLHIAAPYALAGQDVEISMSMGVTVYPLDDSDPDILMRHADEALYEAKRAGRNCFQRYVLGARNTLASR
ncbi:MAG: diguanylate cyclase [Rhodoferax sp.]|uniref:diguanylate cyclase domain-containing protein n=1 Tax=Rhodoferax sp. TaxID=50421 RepID=UPI00273195B6|nr:diguanylate cyclase [Rhodoferax sp.]MDP1529141.1 diguanylate cyclase [Rhodoferax sp.]MDP1942765.1 diguanylate cyclase [Rhodoferax sp.]